jgi:hypothetical protein
MAAVGEHSIKNKEDLERALGRIVKLAREMPCLAEAPGLDPFDPFALEDWVAAKERTPLELHCGRLVLTAYHPFHGWRCGPFDLDVACWVWDETHRMAFTRWARDPVFVWDSLVPRHIWDEPPSIEEMAASTGEPLEQLEARFAEIREKMGVRDQRELMRMMKVVMLLSHGGDDAAGHA